MSHYSQPQPARRWTLLKAPLYPQTVKMNNRANQRVKVLQLKEVFCLMLLINFSLCTVKHAEKRRHLKATSGSSSSDEELRELNKKTKLTAQLSHQHYFLTQLPSRKKVKILPYSKTSIGRPYIDFNKMQSSRMVNIGIYCDHTRHLFAR